MTIMRNDLNCFISAGTKCLSQTRRGPCFMAYDRRMISRVELLVGNSRIFPSFTELSPQGCLTKEGFSDK